MTVVGDVLRRFQARPTGMTDVELADHLGKRHQYINQTCRTLASQGVVAREQSVSGTVNRVARGPLSRASTDHHAATRAVPAQEWAWEGSVQPNLVAHLAAAGWSMNGRHGPPGKHDQHHRCTRRPATARRGQRLAEQHVRTRRTRRETQADAADYATPRLVRRRAHHSDVDEVRRLARHGTA